MDLHETVALSVLTRVSRVRAAAVFKTLRESAAAGAVTLEMVIEACSPGAEAAAVAGAARGGAAALLELAATAAIEVVAWDDERYLPLLRTIADPPPVLWVKGQTPILTRPAVAIVGSRAATPYALEVA